MTRLTLHDVSIGRITKMEADIDGIINRGDDMRVLNVHYIAPFFCVQYLKSLGFMKEYDIDTEFNEGYFVRFRHPRKGYASVILNPASGYRKGFSFVFTKPSY